MTLKLKGQLVRNNGFTLTLDLSLPTQGFTAIVGASGSGKSSLLRAIAGLEDNNDFTITLRDSSWDKLAPHARPIGFVFQDSRLFPHLSVAQNIHLGLGTSLHDCTEYDQIVNALEVNELLTTPVTRLSGGQRQRVALARTLLRPAKLLLLDEPLAALDSKAREKISTFIKTYCVDKNIPTLYVSHNMAEVLQVADHLVLMDNGAVQVSGPTHELADLLIGQLKSSRDMGSILECQVVQFDVATGLTKLSLGAQQLFLPGAHHQQPEVIRLYVPAKEITIALNKLLHTSALNQLRATITNIHHKEPYSTMLELNVEGQTLLAQLTQASTQQLGLHKGMNVHALVKATAIKA